MTYLTSILFLTLPVNVKKIFIQIKKYLKTTVL